MKSFKALKYSALTILGALLVSSNGFAQGMSSMRGPTNYDKVKTTITDLATQYPNNAKLVTVGQSDSGEAIIGLVVGNGPTNHLVVATHHGNEYGSTAVAVAFAKYMAANPMPGVTMHIIPVLNIKGYNTGNRTETDKAGRTVDPNRDYPSPCNSGEPVHLLKSTKALATYVEANNIIGSATLHTYWPAVAYPWGLGANDLSTGFDEEFIRISKIATSVSNYQVGNSTDLLYPVTGAYEDYAFWKHGIWSLLFEMGNSHSPAEASVQKMISDNVPGLVKMFESMTTARAPHHELTGKCIDRNALRMLDQHNE